MDQCRLTLSTQIRDSARGQPLQRPGFGALQVVDDRGDVAERQIEPVRRPSPGQAHGATVDQQGQPGQQVLDLGPFEEAAEIEHRHAPLL